MSHDLDRDGAIIRCTDCNKITPNFGRHRCSNCYQKGIRKGKWGDASKLKAKAKRFYKLHPHKRSEYFKKYYEKNEAKIKQERASKAKFGVCEICNRPRKLCFDHDHETGKFRGWICRKCNSILGFAEDSILILEWAIEYLINSGKGTK